MAGDWIKVEMCTPDKPETSQLADQLGCSLGDAFLACFRLWCWANTHTLDGYARGLSLARIDELGMKKNLGKILVKVGWLRLRKQGVFFPHFERHMSESAKRRALMKSRKSRSRHARSVTKKGQKRDQRREEKRIPPLPPPGFSSAQRKPRGGKTQPPPRLLSEQIGERWLQEEERKDKEKLACNGKPTSNGQPHTPGPST
jgi:hypothetical protein